MNTTGGDDNRPGLTGEQVVQLRQLVDAVETKLKHYRRNADVDEIKQKIDRLSNAVERSDKDEVVKSVRSIAEGIIGGLIVEMIPTETKAWIRTSILAALGIGAAKNAPQQQAPKHPVLIVKVDLPESLRALEILADTDASFMMSISGSGEEAPDVRFWCEDTVAVYLRLGLNRAWVEHPTREEIEEVMAAGAIRSCDLPKMMETVEGLIARHRQGRAEEA